jgi:hypothetical protein
MTKVYTLKSGNTFTAPSLFANPQSKYDVEALWRCDSENALQHIDGLLVNMTEYATVYGRLGFNTQSLVDSDRRTLRDKVKIVDPCYNELLSGTEEQKEKMLKTGFFSKQVGKIIDSISSAKISPLEKSQRIIKEIYDYLQVKPAIEFQTRTNVDKIVSPCVPISSQTKFFSDQVAKARQMLMDSRILLESKFKSYLETRDLMNIVTIHKNVITERNFTSLYKLLVCNDPDQVGIRILGMQESDIPFIDLLFKFLREFNLFMKVRDKPISPVHLINIDELGYASYCSAICNIVSPIAALPYYRFLGKKHSSEEERDTSGKYYVPYDMLNVPMSTLDGLRCTCPECKRFKKASKVPDDYKPIFRRKHWLYVKDDEIRQFREAKVRLDLALRDKFAYSKRTQLVSYIPESPIFTV